MKGDKKNFNLNTNGNDYIVGDIHGMWDELQTELERVSFDKKVDRLFSVGDLVDRGPESFKCLNLIYEDWFHAIKGNHEVMMIDTIKHKRQGNLWINNGGIWSIDIIPELKLIMDDVDALPLIFEIETARGNIGVVHADPGTHDWEYIELVRIEELVWSRNIAMNINDPEIENIHRVVCGHTIFKNIVRKGNIVYIDTGAYYNSDKFKGKLTLMNVNDIFNIEKIDFSNK